MKYVYPYETPCGDELEAHELLPNECIKHKVEDDADFSFCVKNHFRPTTDRLNASLIAERIHDSLMKIRSLRTKQAIDRIVTQHPEVMAQMLISLSNLGEYEEQRELIKDYVEYGNRYFSLAHCTSDLSASARYIARQGEQV